MEIPEKSPSNIKIITVEDAFKHTRSTDNDLNNDLNNDDNEISGFILKPYKLCSLKKLRHQILVYECLCYKAYIFYYIISNVYFTISVSIPGLMIVINLLPDTYISQSIANLIYNIVLIIFSISLYYFNPHGKAYYFNSIKNTFYRLHRRINHAIRFGDNHIEDCIILYEHLDQNLLYKIPDHIIRSSYLHFL